MWPTFDGWCAAQNVEPFELPWDRFLNLVYYFLVRNLDKEGKDKVDSEIAQVSARWAMEDMATTRKNELRSTETDEQQPPDVAPTSDALAERRRKLPPRPAGWGTPEQHYLDSIAVAQSLSAASGTQRKPR